MPAVGNDGGDQNGHGSDSVSKAGGTAKPSNADLVPSLAGGSAGAASGGATDGAAGASRDVGTRAASQITQPGGRSQ